MKYIHYLLLSLIMGLAMLTTACTNKERQLDQALKGANKTFPQQVSEGITLEGFFLEGDNIDMPVTVDEAKQTKQITQQSLDQLYKDFVMYFTHVAHQSKEFNEFVQLTLDNGKTMSITINLLPSKKKHKVVISKQDISKILAANTMTAEEMAQAQLDMQIEAQSGDLPHEMGLLTIQRIHRDSTHIVYDVDVKDETIFQAMKADSIKSKNNAVESLSAEENAADNKLLVSAGCNIIYRYKCTLNGEIFEIIITQKDIRNIVKNSTTTNIK